MKRLPKTGMLRALSEDKNINLNTEDLLEFERDFKKWHTHIFLQKIKYFGFPEIGNNIGDSEPFVIIESLGVFDNLINFSRRLNNELYKNTNKNYKVNPPKISILYRGGSNLDIIFLYIYCSNLFKNNSIFSLFL